MMKTNILEMNLEGRRLSSHVEDRRIPVSERSQFPYCDWETGKRYKTVEELGNAIAKREEDTRKEYEEAQKEADRKAAEYDKEKKDAESHKDTYTIDMGKGRTKKVSKNEYDKISSKPLSRSEWKRRRHVYHTYSKQDNDWAWFGPVKAETVATGTEYHQTFDYTVKTGWGRYLDSDGPKKTAIIAGVAIAAAAITATTVHIMRKRNEATIAGMKASIEAEKDPKKKKELEKNYENLMKSMYNKKGKIRIDPDFSDVSDKDFQKNFSKIMQDKDLRKTGKEYIKKNGSEFLEFDRNLIKKDNISNKEPKEQIVKAKDGSEIHARRKKTGHGMTYVRTRNGKEVGYATKSEFRTARKNESYVGLSEYINESIIGRKGVGGTTSPIYLMRSDHTQGNPKIEDHTVLYLTQEEYANHIDEILKLPGLDTAKEYVNSLIRIGGDVIMWMEEDGMGKPRFFCESMKLIYGVNKISNLPLKAKNYATSPDRFEIVKRIGTVNIDIYKNLFECFRFISNRI